VEPQINTQGEMWRYTTIAREPRIPRPSDWFFPGEYVVCKIDDDYLAGRILEASGCYPMILKICMYQGRNSCSLGMEGCDDSSCRKRLLTRIDNGAVLDRKDLLRVLACPGPQAPIDPRYEVVDYARAEKLFGLIEKLEARQGRRQC